LARGNRGLTPFLQAIKDWSLAGPSTSDLMISYHLKRGDGESALAMIDKAERNLG
jgi:hypothetical protein